MPTSVIAGGAIVLAVLIAAGAAFNWPKWTQYIWATISLLWGIAALLY